MAGQDRLEGLEDRPLTPIAGDVGVGHVLGENVFRLIRFASSPLPAAYSPHNMTWPPIRQDLGNGGDTSVSPTGVGLRAGVMCS